MTSRRSKVGRPMEEKPKHRIYRRRKRWQGATWTPENQLADKPDGVWCRACKTRHGYMTMGITYELRINNKTHRTYWVLLWWCRHTGNVLEELRLGTKREDQE